MTTRHSVYANVSRRDLLKQNEYIEQKPCEHIAASYLNMNDFAKDLIYERQAMGKTEKDVKPK